MNLNLKKILGAVALASTVALAGCGEEEVAVDNSKITIGVIAGAEAQVAEVAAKIAKDKYGLEVSSYSMNLFVSNVKFGTTGQNNFVVFI